MRRTVPFRKAMTIAALMGFGLAVPGCQGLEGLLGSADREPGPQTEIATALDQAYAADQAARQQAALDAQIDDDPQQFMGLDGESIALTLGQPDLIRRDGPAEVLQFRGTACVLDLFMYPGDDQVLSVRHVELRGASLNANAERSCLAEMIRQRSLTG
ncbi:MAG: hypothetical protein RIG88_13170 [Roseitalea porphyridii]